MEKRISVEESLNSIFSNEDCCCGEFDGSSFFSIHPFMKYHIYLLLSCDSLRTNHPSLSVVSPPFSIFHSPKSMPGPASPRTTDVFHIYIVTIFFVDEAIVVRSNITIAL